MYFCSNSASGRWRWINGRRLSTKDRRWDYGPSSSNEGCLTFRYGYGSRGNWEDQDCSDTKRRAVCEKAATSDWQWHTTRVTFVSVWDTNKFVRWKRNSSQSAFPPSFCSSFDIDRVCTNIKKERKKEGLLHLHCLAEELYAWFIWKLMA